MYKLNLFNSKCYFNKQIALVFILLLSIFSSFAQNKSNIERKQLFDYDWKFYLGDTASAKLNDFDDAAWRTLDLPHDWSIEGKINPKNPTGVAGGYFPAGIGWYRKTFKVPGEWKDQKHFHLFRRGLHELRSIYQRKIAGCLSVWLFVVQL